MSYITVSQLAYNTTFRSRVVIGAIDVAKDKAVDAQATTEEKLFAAKVLNDPEKIGRMMAYGVSLLLNGVETSTDADIKTKIATVWAFYAKSV